MAESGKGKPTPVTTHAAADGDKETILARWMRLKKEARQRPAEKPQPKPEAGDSKAPELPPLDKLTFDTDYRAFFHPKVDEELRRAALKKLFGDPHFNVMDGLDVYIDDYSKSDPIPAEMLAQLKQAQKILDWAKEKKEDQAVAADAVEPSAATAPPALAEQTTPPAAAPPAIDQPLSEAQGESQAMSDSKAEEFVGLGPDKLLEQQ